MKPEHIRSRVGRPAIYLCLLFGAIGPVSAQQYWDWSAAVTLGQVVNSSGVEETPFLSKDGLNLYFSSNRPGGFGSSDIWVVSRQCLGAPWRAPVNPGPNINTADYESHPTLTADGDILYFNRIMSAAGGTFDMFWARRDHNTTPQGWMEPVNAGPCINTTANDSAMIFFEDAATGITYTYFNSNHSGNPDFYSTIYDPEAACSATLPVADLNTGYAERNATLRHDGLEILFESNRPGSQDFDIWSATRPTIADHWSTSLITRVLNSAAYDGRPALSWDGTEVYFFSNRGGNFDLYVSTRNRLGNGGGIEASNVLAAGTSVYGKSSGEWLNLFFKWWLEFPREMDPVADQAGGLATARQTNEVWFLATSYRGANPHRSFSVPEGKALFFPIALAFHTEADDPSSLWDQPFTDGTGKQYASRAVYWLEVTQSELRSMTALSCEIDGKGVYRLQDYVVSSPESFHGVIPEDGNRFGSPGPKVGIGAAYCIIIPPLPAGAHTLHALGTYSSGETLELTDTINVKAAPTVSLVRSGSTVILTFTGTLQSADTVTGQWSDLPGTSPQTLPISGAAKFYRSQH